MYLALDIGNVLCKVDFSDFISELGINHNFKEAEVWDFLQTIQPLQDMGVLKMSDELRLRFNISTQLHPKIMHAWNQTCTVNPVSLKYLEEFLKAGVKVAILSNIGHEHRQIIGNIIGPALNECVHHMSCDVGTRKPYLLYYQSFLLEHPEFKGCIYVDDRDENNVMATKCGFKARPIDLEKLDKKELTDVWESIKTEMAEIYKSA